MNSLFTRAWLCISCAPPKDRAGFSDVGIVKIGQVLSLSFQQHCAPLGRPSPPCDDVSVMSCGLEAGRSPNPPHSFVFRALLPDSFRGFGLHGLKIGPIDSASFFGFFSKFGVAGIPCIDRSSTARLALRSIPATATLRKHCDGLEFAANLAYLLCHSLPPLAAARRSALLATAFSNSLWNSGPTVRRAVFNRSRRLVYLAVGTYQKTARMFRPALS